MPGAAREEISGGETQDRGEQSSPVRLANRDLSKWPERIRSNPSRRLSFPEEKIFSNFYRRPVLFATYVATFDALPR